MSEINKLISRMIRACGVDNTVQLAEYIGINQSTVSQWKRRNSVPDSIIARVFELTGVNYQWLKTGFGEMTIEGQHGLVRDKDAGYLESYFNPTLLQNLIQWVEEGCQEHGVTIKPAAKAKLLVKLYTIFSKENPEVKKDEVVRHLRLVA